LKILIIKTSSLGDIVHANSIISDLKINHANVEIHWLVEESFADLLKIFPTQKVIISKFRSWKNNLFKKNTYIELINLKQALRSENYDYVIDLQGLIRTGLISRSLNSFGFDSNSIKEKFASYFYKKTFNVKKNLHAITRNRLLVASVMNYEIDLNNISFSYNFTNDQKDSHSLVFITGTSNDQKKWPLNNWINLARLFEQDNYKIYLPWGNAREYEDCLAICDQTTNCEILEKMNIDYLAKKIASTRFVIGVDTGLTHLSSSLDIPTIGIYTFSNPDLTGVKSTKTPAFNMGSLNNTPLPEDIFKKFNDLA
jgi:heptosyltransferase-1